MVRRDALYDDDISEPLTEATGPIENSRHDDVTNRDSTERTPHTSSFSIGVSSFSDSVDVAFNSGYQEEIENVENPAHVSDHQLLDATDSLIAGKPSKAYDDSGSSPEPLRPYSRLNLVSLTSEFLLCLAPLAFVIMSILASQLHGRVVTQYGQNIRYFTALAPTIFPIVFAAVAGQSMWNLARYKLERGCKLKYIEQFSASKSVFSTITTPLHLQSLDITSILLVLLWLLSPLGSQASLRLLSTQPLAIISSGKIGFTNLTDSSTILDITVDRFVSSPTVDGLYISTLSSSLDIKQGPQDPFGNVKIPTYESLVKGPDTVDFIAVPNSTDIDYISLLGIPMTGLDQNKRVNTTVSSRYYYVDCSRIYGVDGTKDWPAQVGLSKYGNRTTIWNFGSSDASGSNPNQWMLFFTGTSDNDYPNSTVTNMTFASWSGAFYDGVGNDVPTVNVTIAECIIQPSYVDIQVICTGFSCKAAGIRRAAVVTPSYPSHEWNKWWGGLFFDGTETVEDFLGSWGEAQTDSSLGELETNPTLMYIGGNEAQPFISDGGPPLIYNVALTTFTQRMRRLFNTYWQASLGPYGYTNSVPIGGSIEDIPSLSKTLGVMINATDATFEHDITIFKCDPWWLAAAIISSCILFITGVVGFAARCACVGPSVLGSFTSILRAHPDTAAMLDNNNSTRDSMKVAKSNKDLYVALQDARSSEDVGSIEVRVSVHTIKAEESLARSRKRNRSRFYG